MEDEDAATRRKRYSGIRARFWGQYKHPSLVGIQIQHETIYVTIRTSTPPASLPTEFEGMPVVYEYGEPARTMNGYT